MDDSRKCIYKLPQPKSRCEGYQISVAHLVMSAEWEGNVVDEMNCEDGSVAIHAYIHVSLVVVVVIVFKTSIVEVRCNTCKIFGIHFDLLADPYR